MVAAALLAVGSPTPARAANFTWNKTDSNTYSWIAPSNWTALAGFPDDLGDVANLNNNILGDNTIALNANVTLSTLNIGDAVGANSFIIQAGVIAHPGILPLAADYAAAGESWTGLRPMTPSSLPIVRRVRPGLSVNIGHGMLGWTFAMGSAERLANAMLGMAVASQQPA